jgi:hypothetical protein
MSVVIQNPEIGKDRDAVDVEANFEEPQTISRVSKIRYALLANVQLVAIVVSVILGFLIGILIHDAVQESTDPSTEKVIMYIKFPGELFIRMLRMIIILKPVSVAKDLGMHLDLHRPYDDHISKLSSTCINKLCQISRVKESFDKKTLILLIEALVINKLLYSSSVWANTSSKNLKKLQTVQNFACRIITSIKKFDHVTPGLQELNWLSIENLLIYKDTIMA